MGVASALTSPSPTAPTRRLRENTWVIAAPLVTRTTAGTAGIETTATGTATLADEDLTATETVTHTDVITGTGVTVAAPLLPVVVATLPNTGGAAATPEALREAAAPLVLATTMRLPQTETLLGGKTTAVALLTPQSRVASVGRTRLAIKAKVKIYEGQVAEVLSRE